MKQQHGIPTKTAASYSHIQFSEPLDSDYLQSLYQIACALVAMGVSVIPIWGDLRPDTPKAAAVEWATYQHRLASPAELKEWFLELGYGGLAIVCGRISGNLYALDFDTSAPVAEYQATLPDLLNTRTALSAGRRLPHLYYIAPQETTVTSGGKRGVIERRGEGQYIVCYPTRINDNAYVMTQGGQPQKVTTEQYQRQQAFLERFSSKTDVHTDAPAETIPLGNSNLLVARFNALRTTENSRGLAVFKTIMGARDSGWTLPATRAALKKCFVASPPLTDHAPQTPKQRGQEFDSILTSTYKRDPGRKPPTGGLPTAFREYLLGLKANALVRVLDCFVMHGLQPGQQFTEKQAVEIGGQHGLSRKAVRAALQSTEADIKRDRDSVVGSIEPPPNGADVAKATPSPVALFSINSNFVPKCHSNRSEAQQYSIVSVTNGDKIQRGRKSQFFAMPDVVQITGFVGITNMLSDVIPFEALAEISDYRAAVTRALLARAPGQYANKLLAKRVGVDRRTIRRTIKRDKSINSEPREKPEIVTAATVETLIADDRKLMNGFWLDVEGKKYPATREVATKYLEHGLTVTLIKREANYYSVKTAAVIQDTPTTEPDAKAAQGVA